MLEPYGFEEIKKITWKEIEPGMIILTGLKINNTVPHELKHYPALTVGQIYELTQKYHLRKDKEIVVAICKKGESPQKMSLGFAKLEHKIQKFNALRKLILKKREDLLQSSNPIELQKKILDNPKFINQNLKVLNSFNSLSYKKIFFKQKISLLNHLSQNLTIGEVLSKTYKKKFFFPSEFSFNFFLGMAYDKNFKQEHLELITDGYNLLNELVSNVLEKSKMFLYGFSEEVQEIKFPLSGRELNSGKIFFTTFLKRVMHKKNKDVRNLAVLSSFEPPGDLEEIWKLSEKFVKSQIDLYFLFTENIPHTLAQELSKNFHANCILLKEKKAFPLALFEIFDSYLSEISTQLEPLEEVQLKEFTLPELKDTAKEEPKKEKVIKPFEFKRIKREI